MVKSSHPNYRQQFYDTQEGCCAICHELLSQACIDHDHATGMVRGLLCARCNAGLGMFRDSTHLLASAAHYIQHLPAVKAPYEVAKKQRLDEWRKEYRAVNKERLQQNEAQYRETHREESRQRIRRWRKSLTDEERERLREYDAAYDAAHREEGHEYSRAYYHSNKARILSSKQPYQVAYRKTNRQEISAKRREWRARRRAAGLRAS